MGYVDYLAPMIYTDDVESVGKSVEEMKSKIDKKTSIYSGLAPYFHLSPEKLINEIDISRNKNTNGIILFNYSSISNDTFNALSSGIFRHKSVLPNNSE